MGKRLLLLAIRIYWCVPVHFRRQCLFRETCSHHVFRVTHEQGFKKGIQAFWRRFRQCRPEYSILEIEGREYIVLKDHSIVPREETRI